jgi:hypothetical protein
MSHAISELDIQRCVDGELSAAAQQELLRGLDESDTGWRDLALAYVENQVIAGVCRSVAEPDAESSPVSAASRTKTLQQSPRRRSNRIHWTITAASAVIGVGIGLLAGGGRSELSSAAQPTVAATAGASQIDGADSAPTADSVADLPQPVMNVEFADASGDASNWLLPVYAADDLGADYWQGRDVLPADIEQDLSRRGYRLDHEREFYSIPLDDGREIAVPVDTYQVRYTGL